MKKQICGTCDHWMNPEVCKKEKEDKVRYCFDACQDYIRDLIFYPLRDDELNDESKV